MISVLQPVRVCVHLDPKFLSWIRNHPPKVKNPSAKNPWPFGLQASGGANRHNLLRERPREGVEGVQ